MPTWMEPGPDGPVPAPAPRPLPLMELASLVDLLHRWQLAHPEDEEVCTLRARAEAELEAQAAPWRAALEEMAAKLGAANGIPRVKPVRAEPITIHGFDGSERIIDRERGEPIGPTWATYEGTTE